MCTPSLVLHAYFKKQLQWHTSDSASRVPWCLPSQKVRQSTSYNASRASPCTQSALGPTLDTKKVVIAPSPGASPVMAWQFAIKGASHDSRSSHQQQSISPRLLRKGYCGRLNLNRCPRRATAVLAASDAFVPSRHAFNGTFP